MKTVTSDDFTCSSEEVDNLKEKVNTAKEAADEVVTTQEAVIASETEKYEAAVAAIQALTSTSGTSGSTGSTGSSASGSSGSSSPTTAESTPSSPSTRPETSSNFSEDPAQSTRTIVTSTRFESTESDTSSAGPMSTSTGGPISSTETSAESS